MNPSSRSTACAVVVFVQAALLGSSAAAQCESQIDRLIGKDSGQEQFAGESISMSGSTVIVGANGQEWAGDFDDYAYVYEVQDGVWPDDLVLLENPYYDELGAEEFGWSVAIDGDRIAVGVPKFDNPWVSGVQHGAAMVWERQGGVWSHTAVALSSQSHSIDHMGKSIALDGDLLAVGAPYGLDDDEGSVHVFRRQSKFSWTEIATLYASDPGADFHFGSSVAIDGNTIVVGAVDTSNYYQELGGWREAGAAYVFEDDGSGFAQVEKLFPPADAVYNQYEYGRDVDVSGDRILVSAHKHGGTAGRAYAYHRTTGGWSLTQVLDQPSTDADFFGFAVALEGPEAVISAPIENGMGAVYSFSLANGLWVQDARFDPPEASLTDYVGFDVAISGSACAFSAPYDDGDPPFLQVGRGVTYVYALDARVGQESCPGVPNSTGLPATLTAHGTEFATQECLTLDVVDLPANQFTFFLMAPEPGFVANPGGSDGNLCLGSSFLRLDDYVMNSGPDGSVSLALPFQDLPGGTVIQPGDVWYFQLWYRDGASSNLSNALRVDFR